MLVALPPRIKFITNLGIQANRILDIGCGNGIYGLALKEAFGAKELYGIDIDAEVLDIARSNDIKTSCIDVDLSDIPYADNYFEVVFAGEVIEHGKSPDKFLAEIFRVLKPGGYLILTTPNIASWYDRVLLLLGFQPYSIPIQTKFRGAGAYLSQNRDIKIEDGKYVQSGSEIATPHIQFFTTRAITKLIRLHNFKVVRVIGNPVEKFTFKMNKVMRQGILSVDRIMAKSALLASGVTVVAQKDA